MPKAKSTPERRIAPVIEDPNFPEQVLAALTRLEENHSAILVAIDAVLAVVGPIMKKAATIPPPGAVALSCGHIHGVYFLLADGVFLCVICRRDVTTELDPALAVIQ